MAKNHPKVLLGFEDEIIGDKNKNFVNFKTNKIGGKPDIPNNLRWENPNCSLCRLPQPLVVQVYAPFENSSYHRTIYIFACVNPNCWNQNDSWTCLRVQTQEPVAEEASQYVAKANTINWCVEADDWDDDNNANDNEENGNIINSERISDEDDESFSLDESIRCTFENLTVDDKNANIGAQGGAVGRQHSPAASAEIEGDEGEIITIDSPTKPQNDMAALFHENIPLPAEICNGGGNLKRCPTIQFSAFFMNVWEESDNSSKISDKHVKDLLQEYQHNEDFSMSNAESESDRQCESFEKYEKDVPAHGDKMFHYFLSRIQRNPGQILRYSRDIEGPLLLYPQLETIKKCQYCQEERIFEFQILSTIIPKLRLHTDPKMCTRLEFGTALIYTCKNSCWSSDIQPRQEIVIIQKEIY
ncbi:hypothetical protein HHI36_012021 [Cryptolaemus montrouzieri]|uniref:Programmed cell death protein 2 C-terminal domain-containing protein n=1 Tax=Cryptolaemus montrouzieri TaxID=559131 RepID=A0ABD2NE13_9CUCU